MHKLIGFVLTGLLFASIACADNLTLGMVSLGPGYAVLPNGGESYNTLSVRFEGIRTSGNFGYRNFNGRDEPGRRFGELYWYPLEYSIALRGGHNIVAGGGVGVRYVRESYENSRGLQNTGMSFGLPLAAEFQWDSAWHVDLAVQLSTGPLVAESVPSRVTHTTLDPVMDRELKLFGVKAFLRFDITPRLWWNMLHRDENPRRGTMDRQPPQHVNQPPNTTPFTTPSIYRPAWLSATDPDSLLTGYLIDWKHNAEYAEDYEADLLARLRVTLGFSGVEDVQVLRDTNGDCLVKLTRDVVVAAGYPGGSWFDGDNAIVWGHGVTGNRRLPPQTTRRLRNRLGSNLKQAELESLELFAVQLTQEVELLQNTIPVRKALIVSVLDSSDHVMSHNQSSEYSLSAYMIDRQNDDDFVQIIYEIIDSVTIDSQLYLIGKFIAVYEENANNYRYETGLHVFNITFNRDTKEIQIDNQYLLIPSSLNYEPGAIIQNIQEDCNYQIRLGFRKSSFEQDDVPMPVYESGDEASQARNQ